MKYMNIIRFSTGLIIGSLWAATRQPVPTTIECMLYGLTVFALLCLFDAISDFSTKPKIKDDKFKKE